MDLITLDFETYYGKDFSLSRSNNSNNMDNFRDAAGYLALAAELNS